MSNDRSLLKIKLLGGFDVWLDGREIALTTSKKAKAILCFLAMNPGSQSRIEISSLLWTENPDEFARANLRQALSVLRKDLRATGSPVINNIMDGIEIDLEKVELDVEKFRIACAGESCQSLEQAAMYYKGEFLDGFYSGAPTFDDWIEEQRSSLSQMHEEVLCKLLAVYEDGGATDKCIEIGESLLVIDPLREKTYCSLMQAHHARRDRNKIIRCYRTCKEVLWTELRAQPGQETQELYRRLVAEDTQVTVNKAVGLEKRSNANPMHAEITALESSKTDDGIIDRQGFSYKTLFRLPIQTQNRHRALWLASLLFNAVLLVYVFYEKPQIDEHPLTLLNSATSKHQNVNSPIETEKSRSEQFVVSVGDEQHFPDDPDGLLSFLFEGGDINDHGDFDGTPLFRAVKTDNIKVARLLIAMGADPDVAAKRGRITPLHQAASLDNADMIKLLTKAGANPNARDFISRTPLFHAATADSIEAIDALVAGGAVVDRRERVRGKTPLLAALAAGNIAAAQSLVQLGADINIEAHGLCKSRYGAAFLMATLEHSLAKMNGVELVSWVSRQGGKGADEILTFWQNRGGPSAASEARYRAYYEDMVQELTRISTNNSG